MSNAKKKAFVNPFNNPGVGRRTGVNVLEGKTIRKLSNGMDNFDDYWSDSSSGEDSLASLAATPTPKQVAVVQGNSSLRSMTPFSAESQPSCALVDISNVAAPTITIEPAEKTHADSPNKTAAGDRAGSRLGVSGNPSFTLNQAGDETGTISRNETARSRTESDTPAQGFKTKKRLTYSAGSDGKLTTSSTTQDSIKPNEAGFIKPASLAPKRSTRASAQQQSALQVSNQQVPSKETFPNKSVSRVSPKNHSGTGVVQTNPDPIALVSDTTLEQSVATPSFDDHTHKARTRSTRSSTRKISVEEEVSGKEEHDGEAETMTEEGAEDELEENENETDEVEPSTGKIEQSEDELEQNDSEEAGENESQEDEGVEPSTCENEQTGNDIEQNISEEECECEGDDEVGHESRAEKEQSENGLDQNDLVGVEGKENESKEDEDVEPSTDKTGQHGNELSQNDSVEDEVKEKDTEEIEPSIGENEQADNQNDFNEEEDEESEGEVTRTQSDVLNSINNSIEHQVVLGTLTPIKTMSDTTNSLSGFISIHPITKIQLTSTQRSTRTTSPSEEESNSSDGDDFAVIVGQDVTRKGRKSSIQPANRSLEKSKSLPVKKSTIKKSQGDSKKKSISQKSSTNTRRSFDMSSSSEDEEHPVQTQSQGSPVKKSHKGKSKKQKASDEKQNKGLEAKATGAKSTDIKSRKKSVRDRSPISKSQGNNLNTKKQTKGKTTKQNDNMSGTIKELAVKKGRPRGRPPARKSISNANNENELPNSPPHQTKKAQNSKKTRSTKKQVTEDPGMVNDKKTTKQHSSTRSSDGYQEQENELPEEEITQKTESENEVLKRKTTQRRTSTRSAGNRLEQENEISKEEVSKKGSEKTQVSKSLSATELTKSVASKRATRKKSELQLETQEESEEVEVSESNVPDIPVGSVSLSEEEEKGYDGDEDEGQVIGSAQEDHAMGQTASNTTAASQQTSIVKTAPAAKQRNNSDTSGDGGARRKSSRKRCAPVAWYNNETSPLEPQDDVETPSATPGHKSNSDVGDELSPLVVKKPKHRKAQPITETPLSVEVTAVRRRTIQDKRVLPRKSILKSEGTPRRSIASTHFAEELPIYSARKSLGVSKLPRYSTASPLHFNDITRSQTPHVVRRKKKTTKIVPPRTPAEGIRRSRRTKVKPLEWFRNERIIYKRDDISGTREVAGIDSPSDDDVPSKEKKLKRLVKKKRDKMKAPKTPRRLSMHKPFEEEVDARQNTDMPVVNPTTNEEVLVDCIRSRDTLTYRGPLGGPPCDEDPFLMSKAIVQKVFSTGKLIIKPSGSKGRQIVHKDSMVFYIIHGKLGVEIHETSTVLESGDFFFVPQGNTYSIQNLRHEEAKLVFYQHKH